MNYSPQFDSEVMSDKHSDPHHSRTALVLGGGGSAGNAWLVGIIAGLFEAGTDVTKSDLIIGTSAGATAAAQITGASPARLLADILSVTHQQRAGETRPQAGRPSAESVSDHMERLSRIITASRDAADYRRRLGESALEMESASDAPWSPRWRATVAARLSDKHWPKQAVLITAVNARTGEPRVFDRHSGVDLVEAVAASTSSGVPFAIGDDRYIDGGFRRNENADLAAGYSHVLVLSPLSGRTLTPLGWGMSLDAQVAELRSSGSRVHVVLPDDDSLAAFGDNMMDLSARPSAARAGHSQGATLAKRLTDFWR